ncbi:AMIN-like domain-containing (lipo)protein [Streptomyces sp. NPDC002867]
MRASRRTCARIAAPLAAAALVSALASPVATAATSAETRTATATATCPDSCILGTRSATHTGYDRLVFDLTSGTQVRTSTNTTGEYYPPSGVKEYLDIPGTSYLFITMEPAHVYDDAGNLTFKSPFTQALNLPTLKGVQLTSLHAATVDFGLSLGPSTRYHVSQLTQPNRLVVDIYR